MVKLIVGKDNVIILIIIIIILLLLIIIIKRMLLHMGSDVKVGDNNGRKVL
jgi:hypothetical protein